MRVLVTGANGLIGSAICARLVTEGHDIRGVVRHDAAPGLHRGESIVLDMSQAIRAGDWLAHLEGVDAVVNCAGSLQRSARDDPRAVHDRAAAALFEACEQAGVCKVIHFSAIGVERDQPSEFSATKLAGDEALAQRDLDWIILRPSVVLGRPVFGASAMFRGLAALPVLPTMPDTGRLQVVQLDDVVSTVSFFLRPGSPTRLAVDLAGPDALTMDDVIALYRLWLGWPPQRSFTLPDWAAGLLYRHGDFAGGRLCERTWRAKSPVGPPAIPTAGSLLRGSSRRASHPPLRPLPRRSRTSGSPGFTSSSRRSSSYYRSSGS
jgi:uncharacterized protein YbjT (DUF2867 family)